MKIARSPLGAASIALALGGCDGARIGDPRALWALWLVPALTVFYQVSDAPLFTLGGHHLVSEAITRCGGRNVFETLTMPAPQVSTESVLAADPQVILAGTDNAVRPAWLDAWTRWPALAAVRRHALYAVDANLLHRPGPRFADGVAQLCEALAKARRTQP